MYTDDELTTAAQTVLDGLYAAWTDNDADAFVSWYTEDATSAPGGSFYPDRAAIRAGMAAGFEGPLKGSTVTDRILSVRPLGSDSALVVSRAAVHFAGEDQVPDDRWVLSTWALTRQNGRLLVAAYHNGPAPATS